MLIPAKYLKAALLFASKKDIRSYLNGVLFESLNGQARLVATDGNMLAVFRLGECLLGDMQVIIPRECIEKIKLKEGHVTFIPNALTYGLDCYAFNPIDARYPDYRRVILKGEMSGVAAQFGSELLVILDKAYKILNPGSKWSAPYIAHNGLSGALVDLNDDNFLGVIMPLNLNTKGMRPLRTKVWL